MWAIILCSLSSEGALQTNNRHAHRSVIQSLNWASVNQTTTVVEPPYQDRNALTDPLAKVT